MKFRHAVAAATVAAIAVGAGSAHADPPTHGDRPGPFVSYVPASESACGALVVEGSDNTRLTFYDTEHGALLAGLRGRSTATVTSVVSGRSIDLNISGPLRVLANGDFVGSGPWLITTPGFVIYARGSIYVPGGDANLAQVTGTSIDLCEVLVG